MRIVMAYDLVLLGHVTLHKWQNKRLLHSPKFRQSGSEQKSVGWEVGSRGLALINLLNNYPVSTYYVPGTILGSVATAVNIQYYIVYLYNIYK